VATTDADYTFVFLKTGPQSGKLTAEANQLAFAGHFSNMARLAEEGTLLVAGPFGTNRHDEALRGLFILDTADRDEAIAWASTDPTTRAGVFTLEYHALRTTFPLPELLAANLERQDRAKAEGRTLKPGDGGRGYVLLTVADGARARGELDELAAAGQLLLRADLDGTRALAVLDAVDLAAAQALLGERGPRLGEHALDEWFGSDLLAAHAKR
jgi:uncharacterized protein YciI